MLGENGRFQRLTPRTLRFDVVQSIRSAILDGTLSAGSPLVEARIAEEMGISRAPVREALRELEEEGLIVSIPYRGTYVAEVTPEAIREILSLRTVMEQFAAEMALPRLRGEAIARFKTLVAEMRSAAAEENTALLVEVHLAFHRTLYELANHSLLLQFWGTMESQLRLYLRLNHLTFGSLKGVADSHEELVAVFEEGDLSRIKACLVQHVAQNATQFIDRHGLKWVEEGQGS